MWIRTVHLLNSRLSKVWYNAFEASLSDPACSSAKVKRDMFTGVERLDCS
jgi:hypothetical protein